MTCDPVVSIDELVCISCGTCIEICPTDVFRRSADDKALAAYQEDCQFCFMCVFDCPVKAISISIPHLNSLPKWWPHW